MTDLKKFEYFYLRYAPYPTMDDYVTFGVVMLENAPGGFAGVRFMKSWRRLLCSHPDADLDYFHFLEQDIREHLSVGVRRDELLAKMYDCFGNAVQLSAHRECLAEDAEAAMAFLVRGAIDIPVGGATIDPRARRTILKKVEEAYQAAGIWSLLFKNIAVSGYTYPGDPLKIDVSYRPNGVIKMLQALSLEASIDSAKALAFSYPQLVAGIKKKEEAGVSLTAVVADGLDRNDPAIEFALGALERTGIRVAVVAELPLLAETARQELRVTNSPAFPQ